MSNRIRLALLLVLYCIIFWDASPDAIAPLMFAVPFFAIPAAKVGLSLSAGLFVASSSPITLAAITAIPFAVVVVWPRRKQESLNKPAAQNAGIPSRLGFGHRWPGVPER